MTTNDIKVVRHGGEVRKYRSASRNASGASYTMKPGEPVKDSLIYAHLLATGDPEIGTDIFIGIVAKESEETATAVGDVQVITLNPGRTVLRGQATTTTNIDTIAKIRTYLNNFVCFDLTASTGTNGIFTIEESETDDPNVHALRIINGNPIKFWLDVIPHVLATEHAGGQVGQTID